MHRACVLSFSLAWGGEWWRVGAEFSGYKRFGGMVMARDMNWAPTSKAIASATEQRGECWVARTSGIHRCLYGGVHIDGET